MPADLPGQSTPSMSSQNMQSMPGQSMRSMPYQSINISQTTLAGHSMPAVHTANPRAPGAPPSATPGGSIPPIGYPQGSSPPQSQMVPQPTSSGRARRIIVILAAAIVVSTIGILIVLLT